MQSEQRIDLLKKAKGEEKVSKNLNIFGIWDQN